MVSDIRTSCPNLFLFILIAVCSVLGCSPHYLSQPQIADRLRKGGDHAGAIEIYRKHIEYRLNDTSRNQSENPYFYELIIGDILLESNKSDEAIASYKSAQRHGVDKSLIADRIRQTARWFEQKGDLDKAMDFLKENRELDEFGIDYELDRIYRKSIEAEEDANDT